MNARVAAAVACCVVCVACVAYMMENPRKVQVDTLSLPRDEDTFRYLSPRVVHTIIPPATTSLGLLASHMPEDGQPCPNLLRYLWELAEQFDVLVLLTNRRLPARTRLPPNCRVVLAPNQGLDFGKWMFVLHHTHLPSLRRLGLFNDSAFLVRSLRPSFHEARRRGWRVWGMTSSEQLASHLQSYFLVADGAAAARHMLAFFSGRSMQHTMARDYTKVHLVHEFELGLSAHMARRFELRAFHGTQDEHSNPSMEHWNELLDQGCPLLKKLRQQKPEGAGALARMDPGYAATITNIDDRVFGTQEAD